MVAETPEQLRMLERKVAFENAHGIESTIISRSELAALAPYISDRMIGAEFCPHEGKVNPLLATVAIAAAAVKSGARIHPLTELEAWAPAKQGFEAHTSRGRILCRRAVIAAGGWCGSVAALLGVRLPAGGRPIQINVTEPTRHRVDHLVYSAGEKLSFKQAKSGNLIIGGGWPATFNPATGLQMAERAMIQANLWTALQVVPDLAHIRLIRTWTGMVNQTPDARPVDRSGPGLPGPLRQHVSGHGIHDGPELRETGGRIHVRQDPVVRYGNRVDRALRQGGRFLTDPLGRINRLRPKPVPTGPAESSNMEPTLQVASRGVTPYHLLLSELREES